MLSVASAWHVTRIEIEPPSQLPVVRYDFSLSSLGQQVQLVGGRRCLVTYSRATVFKRAAWHRVSCTQVSCCARYLRESVWGAPPLCGWLPQPCGVLGVPNCFILQNPSGLRKHAGRWRAGAGGHEVGPRMRGGLPVRREMAQGCGLAGAASRRLTFAQGPPCKRGAVQADLRAPARV